MLFNLSLSRLVLHADENYHFGLVSESHDVVFGLVLKCNALEPLSSIFVLFFLIHVLLPSIVGVALSSKHT